MLVLPGGGVVGISEVVVDVPTAGVSLAGAGGSGAAAAVLAAGASFGGASPEINFAQISNNKVKIF